MRASNPPLPEILPLRRGSLPCHFPTAWDCIDCQAKLQGVYMVLDEIWGSANLSYHENVCQPCLEKRLGRRLELEDYTTAACNRYNIPAGRFTEEELELHFSRAQENWDKAVKHNKFLNWYKRELKFESSRTRQSAR